MTVAYNVIVVFTSEEARSDGKPVADAIIDVLRNARIAARCFAARGQAGYYENGEIASARLDVLSSNLPLTRIIHQSEERKTAGASKWHGG